MTQAALPLEPVAPPPLREAYERTDSINRRMTFEQALTVKPIAIALRCYAEAITKERK